jgi:hypothetical protein
MSSLYNYKIVFNKRIYIRPPFVVHGVGGSLAALLAACAALVWSLGSVRGSSGPCRAWCDIRIGCSVAKATPEVAPEVAPKPPPVVGTSCAANV